MARTYAPNRIKELRKLRGLSQQQLGDVSGIGGYSTVAKLETGAMALSLDYILKVATALKVHPAEVFEARSLPVRQIPLLGAVTAGPLAEQISQAEDTIVVPDDLDGLNLFALRVQGDSMDQLVPDGGVVVVNPDDLDLVERKVYVVANADHETTLKRFMLSPSPRLVPVSSNPEHQPIEIGRSPFVTIGRAVFAFTPL